MKFSELKHAGEFTYQAQKSLTEVGRLHWFEEFQTIGFPNPEQLKEQVHMALELFCQILPTEHDSSLFKAKFPPDKAFNQAFSEVFPNITQFCRDFVLFDEISISKDFPTGFSMEDSHDNLYHQLQIQYPMNVKAFQEKYPSLWSPFSGVNCLEVCIQDKTMSKAAISYTITSTLITVKWLVPFDSLASFHAF